MVCLLTSLRLSISALLASSFNTPNSKPFSEGAGTVDSESPEVEGAGWVCREGPATEDVAMAMYDQFQAFADS